MKKDITNKQDIRWLVDRFYDKVKVDPVIGPFFGKVNWDRHLPIMYAFWENVLFMNGSYSGNPMAAHLRLHERTPLSKEDFDHWYKLFRETVDEYFEGDMAESARQRALSIATMMQIRIVNSKETDKKIY